jgi:hypothetical protein
LFSNKQGTLQGKLQVFALCQSFICSLSYSWVHIYCSAEVDSGHTTGAVVLKGMRLCSLEGLVRIWLRKWWRGQRGMSALLCYWRSVNYNQDMSTDKTLAFVSWQFIPSSKLNWGLLSASHNTKGVLSPHKSDLGLWLLGIARRLAGDLQQCAVEWMVPAGILPGWAPRGSPPWLWLTGACFVCPPLESSGCFLH